MKKSEVIGVSGALLIGNVYFPAFDIFNLVSGYQLQVGDCETTSYLQCDKYDLERLVKALALKGFHRFRIVYRMNDAHGSYITSIDHGYTAIIKNQLL